MKGGMGEKIEYRLECAGIPLHIVRYNAGPGEVLEVGSTVGLRVVEAAASLLPFTWMTPSTTICGV